jgi:hypothetical protein
MKMSFSRTTRLEGFHPHQVLVAVDLDLEKRQPNTTSLRPKWILGPTIIPGIVLTRGFHSWCLNASYTQHASRMLEILSKAAAVAVAETSSLGLQGSLRRLIEERDRSINPTPVFQDRMALKMMTRFSGAKGFIHGMASPVDDRSSSALERQRWTMDHDERTLLLVACCERLSTSNGIEVIEELIESR